MSEQRAEYQVQRKPAKLTPHEYEDLGAGARGGWRYRCTVCGIRSRNPWFQLPQFQTPITITSTYLDFTGPGDQVTGRVWQW